MYLVRYYDFNCYSVYPLSRIFYKKKQVVEFINSYLYEYTFISIHCINKNNLLEKFLRSDINNG